jgi:hypothetical protein
MLWNAQISQIRKFFLIMLFSGGIFVIGAGILRAYFILSTGRHGGAEAARWGIREAFVAFVIGNAPLIYGGGRIWLQKFKQSKACAWIRSRTKGWPVAAKFNALFSQINRSRARTASEKATPGKNLAMLNLNATSDSTSEQGHSSPLSWGHPRLDSRINTQVNSSNTTQSDTEPEIAIQVTRGIKVDVESVKSRNSEPETIETRSRHSRTDSEAGLGPFITDSPSQISNHGRISELPSGEGAVRQSTLQSILHIPDHSQQKRSTTLDDPNDTKWISNDSP